MAAATDLTATLRAVDDSFSSTLASAKDTLDAFGASSDDLGIVLDKSGASFEDTQAAIANFSQISIAADDTLASFDDSVEDASATLAEVSEAAEETETAFFGLGERAEQVADVLTTVFAGVGLYEGISTIKEKIYDATIGAAEWAEQLKKTSLETGLSVEQLQQLEYAADLTNTSADRLVYTMAALERRLLTLQSGESSETSLALRQVLSGAGIDPTKLTNAAAALDQIGQALIRLGPASNAAQQLLTETFGGRGIQLEPVILGYEELNDQQKESATLTDDQTEHLAGFADAWNKAKADGEVALHSLGADLAPLGTALVELGESVGNFVSSLAKAFSDVTSLLVSEVAVTAAGIAKTLLDAFVGWIPEVRDQYERLGATIEGAFTGGFSGAADAWKNYKPDTTSWSDKLKDDLKASQDAFDANFNDFDTKMEELSKKTFNLSVKNPAELPTGGGPGAGGPGLITGGTQEQDTLIKSQSKAEEAQLAVQEAATKRRAELGQISNAQEIQQLEGLENQRYAIEKSALDREIALQQKQAGGGDVTKIKELQDQQEVLSSQHQVKQIDLQDQGQKHAASMADAQIKEQTKAASAQVAIQEASVKQKAALSQIGNVQELQQLKELEDQKYSIDKAGLEKQAAIATQPDKRAEVQSQLDVLTATHTAKVIDYEGQIQKAQKTTAEAALKNALDQQVASLQLANVQIEANQRVQAKTLEVQHAAAASTGGGKTDTTAITKAQEAASALAAEQTNVSKIYNLQNADLERQLRLVQSGTPEYEKLYAQLTKLEDDRQKQVLENAEKEKEAQLGVLQAQIQTAAQVMDAWRESIDGIKSQFDELYNYLTARGSKRHKEILDQFANKELQSLAVGGAQGALGGGKEGSIAGIVGGSEGLLGAIFGTAAKEKLLGGIQGISAGGGIFGWLFGIGRIAAPATTGPVGPGPAAAPATGSLVPGIGGGAASSVGGAAESQLSSGFISAIGKAFENSTVGVALSTALQTGFNKAESIIGTVFGKAFQGAQSIISSVFSAAMSALGGGAAAGGSAGVGGLLSSAGGLGSLLTAGLGFFEQGGVVSSAEGGMIVPSAKEGMVVPSAAGGMVVPSAAGGMVVSETNNSMSFSQGGLVSSMPSAEGGMIVPSAKEGMVVPSAFSFAGGGLVPSAFGGMIVPSAAGGMIGAGGASGTLSVLHPKEMVLPAKLSEGIQGMINRGNAGQNQGDTHIHYSPVIKAMDGKDVMRTLKANRGALVDTIKGYIRDNNMR